MISQSSGKSPGLWIHEEKLVGFVNHKILVYPRFVDCKIHCMGNSLSQKMNFWISLNDGNDEINWDSWEKSLSFCDNRCACIDNTGGWCLMAYTRGGCERAISR